MTSKSGKLGFSIAVWFTRSPVYLERPHLKLPLEGLSMMGTRESTDVTISVTWWNGHIIASNNSSITRFIFLSENISIKTQLCLICILTIHHSSPRQSIACPLFKFDKPAQVQIMRWNWLDEHLCKPMMIQAWNTFALWPQLWSLASRVIIAINMCSNIRDMWRLTTVFRLCVYWKKYF